VITNREQVIQYIDTFVDTYPGSDFGFAHIVLSDYNLDDSSIDFCLLEQSKHDDSENALFNKPYVINFLHWLKSIPESIRVEDGD
jgi:hypothetical protein